MNICFILTKTSAISKENLKNAFVKEKIVTTTTTKPCPSIHQAAAVPAFNLVT